ncbi:MAG: type II toxin-antitoxin system RelE/ParE family toxin [Bacteroidales bacterium]|nr:type II toxin-antitoxin system RelE/ParE family toxin [Bacteroidales bacterium]
MKLRITKSFRNKLNDQIKYIAQDKPDAARKFKSQILEPVKDIPRMPYKNRKSIFFEREDIRDLIVKGYIVVYKINKKENSIEVFGFIKFQESL